MNSPVPPTRPEAVAIIRARAAEGKIEISRNAQRDLDGLGYDHEDVCAVLSECDSSECESDEPSNHFPQFHLYVFIIALEDEPDLYVKVAIDIFSRVTVTVFSFKLDGSPR